MEPVFEHCVAPSIALEGVVRRGQVQRSWLVRGGRRSARPVEGVKVEAEFRLGGLTLLFVSEDCPFEESLHVYLLDAGLAVLDQRTIGHIYSPGVFELRRCSAAGVEFGFFGADHWRASVGAPAWRWHAPFGALGSVIGICSRPLRLALTPDRIRLEASVTLSDGRIRRFRF